MLELQDDVDTGSSMVYVVYVILLTHMPNK